MKRKLLSTLIVLALILSIVPAMTVFANAENVTPVDYVLYLTKEGKAYSVVYNASFLDALSDLEEEEKDLLDESTVTKEELTLGSDALKGLTWNSTDGQWEMNNFKFTTSARYGIMFEYEKEEPTGEPEVVKLNITGTNEITVDTQDVDPNVIKPNMITKLEDIIALDFESVNISGNGTLNINVKNTGEETTNTFACCINCTTLTVGESANVNCKVEGNIKDCYGIEASDSLTVEGKLSVISNSVTYNKTCCIKSDSFVVGEKGIVKVDSGDSSISQAVLVDEMEVKGVAVIESGNGGMSDALTISKSLNVSGTLSVIADNESAGASDGIYCEEADITVSGNVKCKATFGSAGYAYGIYAKKLIIEGDGAVELQSNSHALYGKLTVPTSGKSVKGSNAFDGTGASDTDIKIDNTTGIVTFDLPTYDDENEDDDSKYLKYLLVGELKLNSARIGDKEYETLQKAVDEAKNGDEIILLEDNDEEIIVSGAKSFKLTEGVFEFSGTVEAATGFKVSDDGNGTYTVEKDSTDDQEEDGGFIAKLIRTIFRYKSIQMFSIGEFLARLVEQIFDIFR